MKLVMLTDMEGCAGVNNFHDWVFPGGMFYDMGREILTEEVNAAIRGFMENGACHCKCAGCWKVYGDEAAARKKFDQYKKCTRVYCDRWACGATMDRLTVAT